MYRLMSTCRGKKDGKATYGINGLLFLTLFINKPVSFSAMRKQFLAELAAPS